MDYHVWVIESGMYPELAERAMVRYLADMNIPYTAVDVEMDGYCIISVSPNLDVSTLSFDVTEELSMMVYDETIDGAVATYAMFADVNKDGNTHRYFVDVLRGSFTLDEDTYCLYLARMVNDD